MNKVIREDVGEILDQDLPWGDLNGATVLVTGATGMVGQYVVYTLLELGRQRDDVSLKVVALSRNEARARELFGEYPDDVIEYVTQDVSEPLVLDSKPTHIIHAASPASPDQFKTTPTEVIRANALGTINTLEIARQSGAHFCLISTMEVYGKIEAKEGTITSVQEEQYGALDSLDLRSAYPESKRLAETTCVAYGSQYGVRYTVARLAHTYGPGMALSDTRVQTEFMKKALEGQDIVLKTDGSLERTSTYIGDAAKGIFYTLLAKDRGQSEQVFNISNESARVSVKELAELIIQIVGSGSRLVYNTAPTSKEKEMWSKAGGIFVDCARLRGLGWVASTSLDEGIRRTIQYYKQASGK